MINKKGNIILFLIYNNINLIYCKKEFACIRLDHVLLQKCLA